jgi:hypothetical protein
VPKQFLELVLANPVVLLIIEDRHQHVQVPKQFGEADLALERNAEIRTVAPLRERCVERMSRGLDGVAERLEQRAQECLAAATRQ